MKPAKILIVEDQRSIAENLANKLQQLGYTVLGIVASGEAALEFIEVTQPDLVLMDIVIKGTMDGVEAADRIYRKYQIPIIYLTSCIDDKTLRRAEETGSYGYILKPFRERELNATIRMALSKHGEAARKPSSQANSQLDSVTQLPNRLSLPAQFTQILQRHQPTPSELSPALISVFCLNLDRFNRINNTFGNATGDRVLRTVAQRLVQRVGTQGTVACLNADEFAMILTASEAKRSVADFAKSLIADISRPLMLDNQEVFLTASIGVAFYPHDGQAIDQLIQRANKAMNYAKQQGGNQYQFYTPAYKLTVPAESIALETDLRYALERDEFTLHYQPQLELRTIKIVGAEALIRWQHPWRGEVSPAQFIPLAEATGLIEPIGEWILMTACQQIQKLHQAGYSIRIAVNLSGRQFKQQNLYQKLVEIFSQCSINPSWLELELTEGMLIENVDANVKKLELLKSLGITIAIDDFGTGYSSLSYLQQFPLDILKIDRSFVRNLDTNKKNAAITRAMIAMAHQLDLKVIAEGVETKTELKFLYQHGCEQVQGYLISRPLPTEKFKQFLQKNKHRLS